MGGGRGGKGEVGGSRGEEVEGREEGGDEEATTESKIVGLSAETSTFKFVFQLNNSCAECSWFLCKS